MDGGRFDGITRTLATAGSRRRVLGALLAAALAGRRQGRVVAQDEVLDAGTAAAGNGGTSDASANGGTVGIGDVNSGGNPGAGIATGDVADGAVAIDGGDVTTSTSLDLSADGGTAISDAGGGDGSFAFVDQGDLEEGICAGEESDCRVGGFKRCGQGRRGACLCARGADGEDLCVDPICPRTEQGCTSSDDCPGDQRCVRAPGCCPGGPRVCVNLCPDPRQ